MSARIIESISFVTDALQFRHGIFKIILQVNALKSTDHILHGFSACFQQLAGFAVLEALWHIAPVVFALRGERLQFVLDAVDIRLYVLPRAAFGAERTQPVFQVVDRREKFRLRQLATRRCGLTLVLAAEPELPPEVRLTFLDACGLVRLPSLLDVMDAGHKVPPWL